VCVRNETQSVTSQGSRGGGGNRGRNRGRKSLNGGQLQALQVKTLNEGEVKKINGGQALMKSVEIVSYK